MLASEHILIYRSLISLFYSARSFGYPLYEHNRALECTISFLSLSRLSPGLAQQHKVRDRAEVTQPR